MRVHDGACADQHILSLAQMSQDLLRAGDRQRDLDGLHARLGQRVHDAERLNRGLRAHLGHKPLAPHYRHDLAWNHRGASPLRSLAAVALQR